MTLRRPLLKNSSVAWGGLMRSAAVCAALTAGDRAAASDVCAEWVAGPAYSHTPVQNGYIIPTLNGANSVIDGVGVAYADLYVSGQHQGVRVVRLAASGWTDIGPGYVQDLNSSGIMTGWVRVQGQGGFGGGTRAVRWDVLGNTTTLGTIGTSATGFTNVTARQINAAGTVVGGASYYVGGQDRGKRAVRWNAGTTTATLLAALNTDSSGSTYSEASSVNDAGVAVGYAQRWGPSQPGGGDDGGGVGYNGDKGQRAVRWIAGGAAATELGHLGTNIVGYTNCNARRINASGLAVGWANKYSADGLTWLGRRAVRWNPDETVALELAPLSLDPSGFGLCDIHDLSDAAIGVGVSPFHDADGQPLGFRAVTWDAVSGAVTPLSLLGVDPHGRSDSAAHAVNALGYVVGRAKKFDAEGGFIGWRAVAWSPRGRIIDLNDVPSPGDGWLALESASGISDNLWITGTGRFDPDGDGPVAPASRLFLLRLSPVEVITEPADVGACLGEEVTLTVLATGIGPVSHQWRREGVPMDPVFNPTAATASLTITVFGPPDFAYYDCVVSNECGSVVSEPARISPCGSPACPADFNQDGGIDGSDVDAFFAAWSAGFPHADTNLDGGIDGADVETFFAAWESGGCG